MGPGPKIPIASVGLVYLPTFTIKTKPYMDGMVPAKNPYSVLVCMWERQETNLKI